MHTHRVKILNSADNDTIIILISDHLHFIFLPANERLIDEQFIGGRELEAASTYLLKFFTVVCYTASTAAQGKGRPDNAGKANRIETRKGILQTARHYVTRCFQPNRDHRVIELFPVFGFIDGLTLRTDQLDAILFKDAVTIQV